MFKVECVIIGLKFDCNFCCFVVSYSYCVECLGAKCDGLIGVCCGNGRGGWFINVCVNVGG